MLFVLCGPGGVGKGTVSSRLVEQIDSLDLSRSWTTRNRRDGEGAGAYYFSSREAFSRKVTDGGFLEYAEFLGNFYGTPVPDERYLADDLDLLLEIEVQGATQVKVRFPNSILLLLLPPSMEELERRLIGRGDSPEHVRKRLHVAEDEILAAKSLGAVEFVNRDINETVASIESFIQSRRIR